MVEAVQFNAIDQGRVGLVGGPVSKHGCCSKAGMCCLMTLAIVAATSAATYFVTKYTLTGRNVLLPDTSCNNTLKFWETYYGSSSVVMGAAHFEYAFLFAPDWSSAKGDLLSGKMFICYQTVGMQASGPGNCSNSFTYSRKDCKLSVEMSECQKQVAIQHTDVEIQWIEYDGQHDTMLMDGKTHMPGWTNPAKFPRVTSPIQCPAATNGQKIAAQAPASKTRAACTTKLAYWDTYFASLSVIAGAAHFEYSFLFGPTGSTGAVIIGNLFICFQTLGMQASGPGNCSNSFTYNENTCELSVDISDCQKLVATQHTDVEMQSITYDGTNDAINMVGKTHMPGWTNPAVFPRAPSGIQCPPATAQILDFSI